MVSVQRYREVLGDYISSDERIVQRLQYLEALCRNVIRLELETYVENKKQHHQAKKLT